MATVVPRLGRGARLHLWTELQTLTRAGIPIITGCVQVAERMKGKPTGSVVDDFTRSLQSGTPLAEAAGKVRLGDSFELALLRVGERTGDLPPIFQHMIDRIEREKQLARRILIGLIYPALLVHVAILLVPLHLLFTPEGGLGAYLLRSFLPLGILYALGVGAYLLRHPLAGGVDAVTSRLPIVGKIRRQADLLRFFSALDPLYAAGIQIDEAVARAADTCVASGARTQALKMADRVHQGTPLAEAMNDAPFFPRDCQRMVETAEHSGDMQPTFKALFKKYEAELQHALKIVAVVIPILVFLGVAAYIAWLIISFWVGHYNRILNV